MATDLRTEERIQVIASIERSGLPLSHVAPMRTVVLKHAYRLLNDGPTVLLGSKHTLAAGM
jgi:hypothetical protein